ncbi:uncharacterized protein LOC116611810 isoform X2 [Nematostella vectensis]|uniref:uncharacterized protein LOC116611810 isoform X2 n=1 Tax=Nematostella vectensis TaxID=45351 RepID=UPI00138FBE32|nr:uncharacterized protein LOC116611810 isoform X2 [Nematostella vectensis]
MCMKMNSFAVALVAFLVLGSVRAQNDDKAANKASKKTGPTNVFEDQGKFVFVYDNLFRKNTIQAHLNLISLGNIEGMLSPWQYTYKDDYFNIKVANGTNNIPWTSPFELETFMGSTVYKTIAKIAKTVSKGKKYFPYRISSSMIRRLDFITVGGDDESADDELVATVLLTPNLKKNDYGEVMFYKQDGEMLASVFHKQGRILLWNASVPYIFKPPGMSYKQGIYALTIRLTTLKEKFEEGIKESKKEIEDADQYDKMDFPLSDNLPVPEVAYGKHLKRKVLDRQGRVVSFFDGLFTKGDLDALRLYLLHYNSAYAYQGYDESKDTEHDNVSWIAGIKVSKFIKSRIWKTINSAVEYISNEKGWYPYDVSMNIIRNSHYTRIHEDCENHEDEFTVLMYLTPDWKEEFYGETIYFEEILRPNGQQFPKGKQKYDWLLSVKPMYGRLVVFRGIIPHSARPPSPGFMGARYTFACKVSRTYHIAHAKMLRESIEGDEPGSPDEKLSTDLLNQEYDEPTPERPTKFLEEELAKRKQEKQDRMREEKLKLLQRITKM